MGKGAPYGTVYATPHGGTHRLRYKAAMPVRETLEEVQADLDKFVKEKGLEEVE